MAQAVTHWPLTAEAEVCTRFNVHEIYVGQCGTETGS
jgi:hypothetical protein